MAGGALFALVAAVLPAVASVPAAREAAERDGPGSGSLVMVLDSSGSMADDDGTGRTRMESARKAVGTVVDALPEGTRPACACTAPTGPAAARTPGSCVR